MVSSENDLHMVGDFTCLQSKWAKFWNSSLSLSTKNSIFRPCNSHHLSNLSALESKTCLFCLGCPKHGLLLSTCTLSILSIVHRPFTVLPASSSCVFQGLLKKGVCLTGISPPPPLTSILSEVKTQQKHRLFSTICTAIL
jgi:hypothetical protein